MKSSCPVTEPVPFSFQLPPLKCYLPSRCVQHLCTLLTTSFTKYCWIMCILCTPRPIYRSTSQSLYRPTLDQCIGRPIGWVSIDLSVDILVECRSICRPRCVCQRIDPCINRDIGRVMVDISTNYWQITRSIQRLTLGRYANHWLSAEYRSTAVGISVKSLDC